MKILLIFDKLCSMKLIRRHFETIDSTNTWAKQNAHLLPRDAITLVTALEQTAGRGRFKRRWESPPGKSVLASFCFFIEKHRIDIGNIPQVLAISAARILEKLGFSPQLKWPNDVLLSSKKVAGILAETTPLSDQLCFIAGIGLNVNTPLEVLEKIDRPATSLLVEGMQEFDVEHVLKLLQTQFVTDLELFFDEGFQPFLEEYCRRISGDPNKVIRFDDNRTIWEGRFHSINHDGSLSLELTNGDIKTFIVGEIMWN